MIHNGFLMKMVQSNDNFRKIEPGSWFRKPTKTGIINIEIKKKEDRRTKRRERSEEAKRTKIEGRLG